MAERTALFIDPTTLNVGIGTDRPTKSFHIQGDMLLSGQIYDSTGFPFSLGGGSWRPLSSNQPIVIPPAGGVFATTCNITLQRYSANDMALNVAIAGTITTQPTATNPISDYRLSLPIQLNGPSYPVTTTLGEFWMTASNLATAQTTLYKAVAKTIPAITDRVAIKYLSGTTEVSLAEINAGFHLSLQGMLAYQTDRYVQTAPDESITIPGTNIKWISATYPNPALVAPQGATIAQTGRQGLLRYLGDDLIYNVFAEATVTAQPANTALDYKLSLEYPIELSSYSSNAILGDLWLTVRTTSTSPVTATTFKAYARSIPSDASNVELRYLNGTYDLSLADIEPGVSISVQGNLAYKTTQVASVAIPKEYLPNRLYQDNDGNVAINNAGLPTRARFEIIETSNYPALMVDQRSGSDIAQFRSNVNDVKAIIDARGNLGIGTSIAPLPLTVKGNMQFDGYMYDATGSALWIPGSAVNWQATPSPPAITVPSGGAFTTIASAGLWRYIGNEINYNATLQGTLTTIPTDTTQNFAISLPYPVKLSAYATNAIIGDMWADVYYQSSSNTFKAYARVDPTDANRATLRVLAGTKDDTFSTMLATSTLALKGQINYTTTAIIQTIQVPTAQIPVDFRQDESGQLALNSGGNPPRARFDVTTTNNSMPALTVDQKGTGNIIDLLGNGNPKVIIDANGNVGIGTTQPRAEIDMNRTGAMIVPSGTTSQRPTNPTAGMIRYNNTEGYIETYEALLNQWMSISTFIGVLAAGGNVTEVFASGFQYRIHTFTSVGTSSFQVLRGGEVEYLIVAGGGGGGHYHAGGGGAGGYRTSNTFIVTLQTYTVTVGGGGTGGSSWDQLPAARNGGNSVFATITADGGGGGGHYVDISNGRNGANGGSGGGAFGSSATNNSSRTIGAPGSGSSGQGSNGGTVVESGGSYYHGGGGGGAGGVGGSGNNSIGGNGGEGLTSVITGVSVARAGGGGGHGNSSVGTASAGGGNGATSGNATSASASTGGGGGGGGGGSGIGGAGGSGIVIIRYRIG